jgi:ATP-dependent helicase/nuclease subunit A
VSSKANKWTEEQLAAIVTTGCDLLVAAGAGSGKTAVLVERIIRKVIDEEKPVDIDKLLVVTFTNAAASEMRERVGAAITRELDKNPDSAALQRQLTLLPKTSITTIHSFCLEVIRNNFQVINIDPNFRIADETEMILLKQEIIEELFDAKYEIQHNGFLSLVEAYGGSKSDEKLITTVLELYKFAESSPWPEKWLLESASDFDVDDSFTFENTKWARYLLKSISIEINGLAANMQRAIDIIYDNDELEAYSDNFQQEILALGEVILDNQNTWKSFYDKVFGISFGR